MVQTTEAGCGRGREGMVGGKEGTVVEWDGGGGLERVWRGVVVVFVVITW